MDESDPSKAIWTFQGFDTSSYDEVLPRSMNPRSNSDVIGELVSRVPLDVRSLIVDVACYDASRSLPLSNRIGCRLVGVDISRHGADAPRTVNDDSTSQDPDRLLFVQGRMERLPLADGLADLVWCTDAISCAAVDATARELARVTRPGGWVLVHSTTATERLGAEERRWLFLVLGLAEESMDRSSLERAFADVGLALRDHERVGNQSLQSRLERPGCGPSELLTVARLTEYRERYVEQWGKVWYERVLAWESWALYHALGKLEDHVWLFERP